MVCDVCLFKISPHTLKKWYKDFVKNDDHFSECITGKWEHEWLLDQTDLKATDFLNRFSNCKHTEPEEYLTIDIFQLYLNETLIPTLTVEELKGITWPISRETARVWMHRLGFGYGVSSWAFSIGKSLGDGKTMATKGLQVLIWRPSKKNPQSPCRTHLLDSYHSQIFSKMQGLSKCIQIGASWTWCWCKNEGIQVAQNAPTIWVHRRINKT